MSKNIIIIIFSLLVVSLSLYFLFFKNKESNNISLEIKDKTYQIEIASTINQKSKGLSNRSELCSNCAMLFVFNKDKTLPFWMKDTLIPLDLIWINSQYQVVDIQTAQPETETSVTKLKIYKNKELAKYVLETNAGDSQKIKLEIGDTIKIPLLK